MNKILRRLLLTTLLPLAATGFAQLATGPDPGSVADEAVRAWLEREPLDLTEIAALPTEELCRTLPEMIRIPPPQPGTSVNIEDRQELPTEEADTLRYTYSAERPNGRLEVVQVTLQRDEDLWTATAVGFRLPTARGRDWLQTPLAGVGFSALSLLVLYLLLTPSFLRRWISRALGVIREHRRLVIGTQLFLYGMFALGAITGSRLPPECGDAVIALIETAISGVGATEAYGSGNIARAAVVTFYQNFVVVTVSITFSLSLLLGVPAYLVSSLSFFAQAIPFGLLGAFSGPELPLVLILLLLELTSYFLVVAGGGMLLVNVVRKGFGGFREGFAKLVLMLPIALVLLVLGAWYEAFLVIGL